MLINSEEGFDNGKGAPLFHVYENVARKNDDTGLDKLLHFIYSAMHAYYDGRRTAFLKGFAKELIKDEFKSYVFSDEIGWDDMDMKANAEGIDFGHDLRSMDDNFQKYKNMKFRQGK
ncbi:MAG: hypothetical protein R3Y22_03980 [Bacteroidales bacterium]